MRRKGSADGDASPRVRADKWLWAARFFKTRALAHDAIDGGKVHLDGARIKPGRTLKVGEMLTVVRGTERFEIRVEILSDRRGPASVAQALYAETEASIARRAEAAEQHRIDHSGVAGEARRGRPTKRDRRQIHRFRGD